MCPKSVPDTLSASCGDCGDATTPPRWTVWPGCAAPYRRALEVHRAALGEGHPAYAASLTNLAGLYDQMGRYAEAEPLYRQAMEIYHTALGKGHPAYATTLDNLAGLCCATGRYAEAEPLYRRALEVRRVALGEDHPDYTRMGSTRMDRVSS